MNQREGDSPGRVLAIYLWPVKRGPAAELQAVEAVAQVGLQGDQRRSPKRQVTLLAVEDWQAAAREADTAAEPMNRRANLVVAGISLPPTPGPRLRVGQALIAIVAQTRPAHRME